MLQADIPITSTIIRDSVFSPVASDLEWDRHLEKDNVMLWKRRERFTLFLRSKFIFARWEWCWGEDLWGRGAVKIETMVLHWFIPVTGSELSQYTTYLLELWIRLPLKQLENVVNFAMQWWSCKIIMERSYGYGTLLDNGMVRVLMIWDQIYEFFSS